MVISSIEVLERMSEQQVFDMVVEHLLTQREKSQERDICGDVNCVYRCSDGKKMCAAGIFIPNDLYQEEMEGMPWDGIVEEYDGMTNAHEQMIIEMQNIHDNSETTEWEQKLREYASMHNLEFNH